MPLLDVFNTDFYSVASLTSAINKAPYKPGRLGELGIFAPTPITTTSAIVEELHGKLSVLQSYARGTMPEIQARRDRKARSFIVPHVPFNDAVMADEVQNIRAFGSETQTETVAQVVNDKLVNMRMSHETTHEYHRVGAIQGTVLDADGSTIYNWFTEFGLTQDSTDFLLGTTTTDLKLKCTTIIRNMESALGAAPFSGIKVFCGDTFWDKLVSHSKVEAAYERWQDGQFLRDNQLETGFPYGGLFFERYRGNIGGSAWIAAADAYAIPLGVPGLFQHIMAPADFVETVNSRGMAIYAKQERMKFDKGIELHTQSNPLMIATRPQCLQKLTTSD